MMMISNRSSVSASRSRRMRFVVVVALAALVAAAAFWRAPLSGFFWDSIAPLMHARYSAGPTEAALDSATAALADRDALYQENLDLKARLGRPGSAPTRILGAVLMRPPGTPYDTLVIDAGSAEGVSVGDYVSAGGTVLVGSISEVYAHAARVKLFSAPGAEYSALLQHSGQAGSIPLTLKGEGGGSIEAKVPSGTEVSVGDLAVIQGISGGLAARVVGVEQTESSFVTIYFQLQADPFMLRFVEVWKQPSHDTN